MGVVGCAVSSCGHSPAPKQEGGDVVRAVEGEVKSSPSADAHGGDIGQRGMHHAEDPGLDRGIAGIGVGLIERPCSGAGFHEPAAAGLKGSLLHEPMQACLQNKSLRMPPVAGA